MSGRDGRPGYPASSLVSLLLDHCHAEIEHNVRFGPHSDFTRGRSAAYQELAVYLSRIKSSLTPTPEGDPQ